MKIEEKDKVGEALDMAIEALQQETVSRKSYDHEFNLRKKFEMKAFELERKIAKIEALSEETSTIQEKYQLSEETPTNTPTNTPIEARRKERGMTIKLTREEAIQDLKAIKSFERYARGRLALDIAIEALEKATINCVHCSRYYETEDEKGVHSHCRAVEREQVSFENDTEIKSCSKDSDLISRADAIRVVEKNSYRMAGLTEVKLKWEIDALPSADRLRGEWVNTAPSDRSDNIVCDQCGYNSIARYDFCPNCGADMRETKGEA